MHEVKNDEKRTVRSTAVAILSYINLKKRVLIIENSANIQQDIIFSLTSAVFMSCLDFAFFIQGRTFVYLKKRRAKFRCFTFDVSQICIEIRVKIFLHYLTYLSFHTRESITDKV